jgi:hypothetical protein
MPILIQVPLQFRSKIIVEAKWTCDHVTGYRKSFTHQSAVWTKKTPTQELKWKHIFALKQNMEICKRSWGGIGVL